MIAFSGRERKREPAAIILRRSRRIYETTEFKF
jgi:hypothetical protein